MSLIILLSIGVYMHVHWKAPAKSHRAMIMMVFLVYLFYDGGRPKPRSIKFIKFWNTYWTFRIIKNPDIFCFIYVHQKQNGCVMLFIVLFFFVICVCLFSMTTRINQLFCYYVCMHNAHLCFAFVPYISTTQIHGLPLIVLSCFIFLVFAKKKHVFLVSQILKMCIVR